MGQADTRYEDAVAHLEQLRTDIYHDETHEWAYIVCRLINDLAVLLTGVDQVQLEVAGVKRSVARLEGILRMKLTTGGPGGRVSTES